MTRYVEAFHWTGTIDRFLREVVTELPLLNVCCGHTKWGTVTLDRYEPAVEGIPVMVNAEKA